MDLGMPNMDGYEAARRIRKKTWGKTMTLVALTGWGKEVDRMKTKEAGFDEHLVKAATASSVEQLIVQTSPYCSGLPAASNNIRSTK